MKQIGRFIKRRWPLFAMLLIAIVLLVGFGIYRLVTPRTPSEFYALPDVIPQNAADQPGTIIRTEEITQNLPKNARGWRIMYSSVGLDGQPIAVSGVVAAPIEASDTPRPVLAFAQGTIGNMPECAISHTPNPFSGIPEIDTFIEEGYIVVATDYPGRGTEGIHPYLIAQIAADSVLDSVRAVENMDLNASNQFVVWGRSQGGHTSLWTAIAASDYAPELELVAAAASAPAIDLEGILKNGMNTYTGSIVITFAISAWSNYFDNINLDELIRPELRDKFDELARTCLTTPAALLLQGKLPTPEEYLTQDIFANDAMTALLEENTPAGPINVPLLITHGTADTLIPIDGSIGAYEQRCADGEDVQLVRMPDIEHDAADQSALYTIGWFNDRLAGRPSSSNCPEQ
ncbi:MAG: alpha/beta hydrolase [Anaerolineae bacterium]|nr:alpha/beta hydrolase [Anaerolineae bacterium]